MHISDMFADRTLFSMEVFPPKRDAPVDSIYQMLDDISGINPDFISVTYGAAGGLASSEYTIEIAKRIKDVCGIESVAHLPCVNLTESDVRGLIAELQDIGIENVLALRGDINPDVEPKHDFPHANDLVTFLRENSDFDVIGACYPEGHPESSSLNEDMHNLKRKVDAGVSHLITQLFFDNDLFYRFRERADLVGIDIPIEAGIMPVTNAKQISRMVTLCGATLPHKFVRVMEKYGDDPVAMRDAGIAYAIDQIIDLAAQDVDGIHLYAMNNPLIAHKVYDATASTLGH